MNTNLETYFDITGLADYLKVTEQGVRKWVLNREVPFCKIKKVIRFRLSEIEKWVDNGGEIIIARENQIVDESDLFAEENDQAVCDEEQVVETEEEN